MDPKKPEDMTDEELEEETKFWQRAKSLKSLVKAAWLKLLIKEVKK